MIDFFTEIYEQLLVKSRNSEVLSSTLEQAFIETETLTEKRDAGYTEYRLIQRHSSHNGDTSSGNNNSATTPNAIALPTAQTTSTTTSQAITAVEAVSSAAATVASTAAVIATAMRTDIESQDFVLLAPRYTGSQLARVIRILPTTTQSHVSFKHVEYCALEQVYFDSISVMLADSRGQPIKFPANTVPLPTFIMLHLEKINK